VEIKTITVLFGDYSILRLPEERNKALAKINDWLATEMSNVDQTISVLNVETDYNSKGQQCGLRVFYTTKQSILGWAQEQYDSKK